jgi:hypothetical protein
METSESFLQETERLFDDYISTTSKGQRYLFTPVQREEYRQWLPHPKRPVTGRTTDERQRQHNIRNRAQSSYELCRGRLWRRATNEKPRRLVLCPDEYLEHIAEVHYELEHGAVEKTYGLVAERYYGPVRGDVEFLLARCVLCLV